jgi:O-methyltransferase involved in polyketide biosynthesis
MNRFAYLIWRIFFKKLNQYRDSNRLSVGVIKFVIMRARFVTKLEGVLFFTEKKRKEEEEMKRWGCAANYNFNIADKFLDEN